MKKVDVSQSNRTLPYCMYFEYYDAITFEITIVASIITVSKVLPQQIAFF